MADWYVKQSGSGAQSGKTRSNAWSYAGIDWTGSGVQPGDRLIFVGSFTSLINTGGSGTSSDQIILLADDNCIVEGAASLTSCVDMNGKHYITMEGDWTLKDPTSHGVLIDGSSVGIIINDVVSQGSGNQAFQVDGTAVEVTFNNITGKDCVDDGLSIHAGTAILNVGTFTGNADGIAMATAGVGILHAKGVVLRANTNVGLQVNGANHEMRVNGLVSTDSVHFIDSGKMVLSNFDISSTVNDHIIDQISTPGTLELRGGVISGMRASKYGAVFRATGVCENVEFIGASQVGKGISVNNTAVCDPINCLLIDLDVGVNNSTASGRTTTNCLYEGNSSDTAGAGGWTEVGSVAGDPLHTDAANRDFTKQDASPCLNAGVGNSFSKGNPVGLGGNLIANLNANIGAWQGTDRANNPLHPLNL